LIGLLVGVKATPYLLSSFEVKQTAALTNGIIVAITILFGYLSAPLTEAFRKFNSDFIAQISSRRPSEVISGIVGLVAGLIIFYLLLSSLHLSAPWLLSGETSSMSITYLGGFLILYLCVLTMVAADPLSSLIKSGPRQVGKAKIIDSNVLIDKRIHMVLNSGFLEGPILIPNSVIEEIHQLSDNSNPEKRTRGKRGLECLNDLLNDKKLSVRVLEEKLQNKSDTDSHLVFLAEVIKADLITNDLNLNHVAKMKGVNVLNLNELAISLKPHFVTGERFELKVTREGNEKGQGVGHLPDGTMVVVEGGTKHLGKKIDVIAKSVLQTEAGQIVFARPA